MAVLATEGIPVDLEYIDEYYEKAELLVDRDGDLACITIHGLDSTVEMYLDIDALADLLDRLTDVEEGIRGEYREVLN